MEYSQANSAVRSGREKTGAILRQVGVVVVQVVLRATPGHTQGMATHNTPQLVRFQEEHPGSRQQRSPRGWGLSNWCRDHCKVKSLIGIDCDCKLGTLTLCVDQAVLYNLVKSHRDSSFENLERKSGRGPLGDSTGLVMF